MDILGLISRIEKRDLNEYGVLSDYLEACRIAYPDFRDEIAPKVMKIGEICDLRLAEEVGRDNVLAGKFFELKRRSASSWQGITLSIICCMSNGIDSRRRSFTLRVGRC